MLIHCYCEDRAEQFGKKISRQLDILDDLVNVEETVQNDGMLFWPIKMV